MKFNEYEEIGRKIELLYNEMDQLNNDFSVKNKINCVSSCGGVCCKSYDVEVSPVDLIPLAIEIIRKNVFNEILPMLYLNQNNHCSFWKEGKCTVYFKRATLCRLFGFSANRDKNGKAILSICSYIKQEEEVNKAQRNASQAPNIVFFSTKVNSLMSEWDTSTKPFNKALIYALENILNTYLWELEENKELA